MTIGWKYWANSFVIMKNGEKFYVADTIEELRVKNETGGLIMEIWIADWIGTHRECIWKEDIFRFGEV